MYAPLDASVSMSSVRVLFFTHCFQHQYSRPSSLFSEKKRPPSEVDDVVAAMCEDLYQKVKKSKAINHGWSLLFRRFPCQ